MKKQQEVMVVKRSRSGWWTAIKTLLILAGLVFIAVKLYDKFVGFSETMLDLGRSIQTASDKYATAFNQLKTGRGNLISRAEKLRKLHVQNSKKLPQPLQEYDESDALEVGENGEQN